MNTLLVYFSELTTENKDNFNDVVPVIKEPLTASQW